MTTPLSRRDFLKLGLLSAAGIATAPLQKALPPEDVQPPMGIGRVAVQGIYLYTEPNFKSQRAGIRKRDDLLLLYEEVTSPHGPAYNPRWYRTVGAYVHSAHLQRVETQTFQHKAVQPPESGQLGEVTVAYTQSYRPTLTHGWQKLYRLYYRSVHWVTGLQQGPDKALWYELTDELLHVKLMVPTAHIRLISPEELTPLAADVPVHKKVLRVYLADQRLEAYEGEQMVRKVPISSGVPTKNQPKDEIPTETPRGHFYITLKMPSKHMGDGRLTDDPNAYELLGVPWTCFFHADGYAFHGTYWHDNFGVRMSHGCINLRNEDALWLYRWSTPAAEPQDWFRKGRGTDVFIE